MDRAQLGAFIAENRKRLGLTQRELADRLHVTDKAVSKWERGLSYPDVTLLEPLADAFGLSLTELVGCVPPGETAGKQEEQTVKSMLTISADTVTATRKRGRRWIAVLGAACLVLATVLLLLSWPFSLSRLLSFRAGVRIESASVIGAGTAETGLPETRSLSEVEILRLERCLGDGAARWRGFGKETLIWNEGTLYTLHLDYNNGQSADCRILNGMLYTDSFAYRLDPGTAVLLDHSLASFFSTSRWTLPYGTSWDRTAVLYWRDGSYDIAGPLYVGASETAALRQMVTRRTFEENEDFTMKVMFSSDWFAGGDGKFIVDGLEYTYYGTGELYSNSGCLLAAEPLTADELALIRRIIDNGRPPAVEGGVNTVTYFRDPDHFMRHGFRVNAPEEGVSLLVREYDDGQLMSSALHRYGPGDLEELFLGLIASDEKNLELNVSRRGIREEAEERWPLLQYVELPERRGYQIGAANPRSDLEPVPLAQGEAVVLYCACVSNTYCPNPPIPETLTEETIARCRGHLAVVWLFLGDPPAWASASDG